MALSLLELAANVRQKKSELDSLCDDMRHHQKEWVAYSMGGEDAMKIAEDGLRNCWTMLDRMHQLAKTESLSASQGEE